jgi:prepilin-type N-terminal cleavage/methylation domain-containing protein/prepilin-type processing-associated H-X9-DG protein
MTSEASLARPAGKRRGFSLVELLTVVGLIALLLSLLLPVVGKVRAAADATACLSNLRQMGAAWVLYTTESRGHLMHYAWYPPDWQSQAWDLYWPGVLDAGHVRGPTLLCPAAGEPSQNEQNLGYGNASLAWTGRFFPAGTVLRLNETTYRDGSYGYNRYLTAEGGFGMGTLANKITAAKCLTDLPVFLDCANADVRPVNGTERSPVESPPNLRGDRITIYTPDHWNFLLARHGRGVNVCMADGSARWTPLEELYELGWRNDWVKYRLKLPAR